MGFRVTAKNAKITKVECALRSWSGGYSNPYFSSRLKKNPELAARGREADFSEGK
jgi:hypothetical protein